MGSRAYVIFQRAGEKQTWVKIVARNQTSNWKRFHEKAGYEQSQNDGLFHSLQSFVRKSMA